MYHISVLKNEVLSYLVTNPQGVYLDVTVGGAGHSYALLEKYSDIKMIVSDWDYNAIKQAQEKLSIFGDRVIILHSSFAHIKNKLEEYGINKVHGVLADFGTSQYQLLHQEGFSFRYDSFLDMRMSTSHSKVLAADILKMSSEKQLADIFYYYGQERAAKKVARKIIEERMVKPIRTSLHLAEVIESVIPRHSHMHPATKVFQALRIAVNKELEQIESLLNQVPGILEVKGRLACISFHSLEDGLVKQFYKNNKSHFAIIGQKIILPTEEEIRANPASRSAKMSVLEKVSCL